MRILYLTNGFPFPLTSGYLRHYFLIRGLSRRHEITLLSVVGRTFEAGHAEALEPFTRRIKTFGNAADARTASRRALTSLKALLPTALADAPVRDMQAEVRRCLGEGSVDAVVFSGRRTYPAIAGLRGVPIVVDLCDATSVRIRGRMPHSGWLRRMALWAEYMTVRDAERRLIHDAEHLLFATSRDRDALMRPRDPRATIVPNGVDLEYWTRRSPRLGTDAIVMTGAMDYAPNRDAAHQLIAEIFPRVRQRVPEARLLIVGRDAPPDLVRLGNHPGVTVTGFVPDVRPYLEEAAVFAAPLRFAAGIQNKLLEAMAMGLPVVASSLAADGLRTEEGEQPPLAVADTADAFAGHLVDRLLAARRDPTPDRSGRAYVERHFVWDRSAEKLDQVLSAVVTRSAA